MFGYPGESTGADVTERDNDASVSDIPWASVFDPALNIRARGEIQARGFRAAPEVVHRLIRMADTKSVTDTADSTQAPGEGTTPPPDVDRVLQVWQRLATQAVESLRGAAQPRGEVASVDIQHATSSGAVSLG